MPARLTEPASLSFVPVEQLSAPSLLCNSSTLPSTSSETPAASPSGIGPTAPRINPPLNKRRKFNEAWKRDFPWVEFDAAKQVVFCGPCKWVRNPFVNLVTLLLIYCDLSLLLCRYDCFSALPVPSVMVSCVAASTCHVGWIIVVVILSPPIIFLLQVRF